MYASMPSVANRSLSLTSFSSGGEGAIVEAFLADEGSARKEDEGEEEFARMERPLLLHLKGGKGGIALSHGAALAR